MENESILKEVGSFYDYPIDSLSLPTEILLETKGSILLSTCRDAIRLILRSVNVNNKVVVVPPFTCHALIQPFEEEGYTIVPYKIGRNLSILENETLEQVKKSSPSIFIFHSYFGFNTMSSCVRLFNYLIKKKVYVIEDKTHSIFTDTSINPHFLVGSLRKWFPIPDGGFLKTESSINEDLISNVNSTIIEIGSNALTAKYNFLNFGVGNKDDYYPLFIELENSLDNNHDIYMMSQASKYVISRTNIESLKLIRKNNFNTLTENIHFTNNLECVFNVVKEDEVPFMFPIYVKRKRKELQSYLTLNKIYATVIWGCPECLKCQISYIERIIYDEILCISCDQRYSISDMLRVANVINSFNFNK